MVARLLAWVDTRRGFWIVLTALTLVSAALRLLYITSPPARVFDEVYSPVFAWKYLHGEPFFDVHPMLAELPHALGLSLFGDTPLGWRFGPWLWGAAFLPGLGVFGALLTGRRLVGALAALLGSLDIAYFVYGRTGLPDMFLLATFVWAFALFFLSCRLAGVRGVLAALGAGVLFGNLAATKWFGVGAIVLVWLWVVLGLSGAHQLLQGGPRRWVWPVAFLIVPVLTYLLWLVPLVGIPGVIRPAVGETFFQGQGCTFGRGSTAALPAPRSWVARVRHWHCTVWNYHAYLDAKHPYGSPWWSWPLLKHPVLFYLDTGTMPPRRITATGNPVIWWSAFGAVMLTTLSLVPRWMRTRQDLPVVDLWLLLGIFGFWLPWALVHRVTFHYHYFLSFTLSLILLAFWLARLLERPTLRPFVLAFLAMALATFLFLYPSATALQAPWVH